MEFVMRSLCLLAVLVACTVVRAAEPTELRLGDVATPQAYHVSFAIDPAQPTFAGEVRIEMLVNRETDTVVLNAKDIEIDQVVFTQGEAAVPVTVRRDGDERVAFDGKFLFGSTTAIVRYHGKVQTVGTHGLFRRSEDERWYVVSQFESMDARRAIPSFDDPAFKTPWDVTIDAPASNRVVSNGRELDVAEVPGRAGWMRHRFARTPALPTYLVAVAVGPFDIMDGGRAGAGATPLRFMAPKGHAAEAAFARQATPRLVELTEGYFGSGHPFEKLDSLAVPGAARFGAMENAALITYERGLILARPQDESLAFKRRYVSVAAHEIAHQWVGDLVTLAWWDDAWLNEAFATWLSRKTSRAFQPAWEGGWRHGDVRRRALKADRLTSARQVHNPVRVRDDVTAAFDDITYAKGAEVLSMFESWLGEEAFRRGVREYLAAHAHGNATSEDFFRVIGRAGGRGDEAVEALRSFVDQPGLPLVDVALACGRDAPALRVSQRRFTGVGQRAAEQRWITPACFTYRANGKTTKQCTEIRGESSIPLQSPTCPEWIVGNADGAGHWVPRYDAALARTLESRVVDVPEPEAVALAGDTALLVNSGLMPRDQGFRLADAFLRHPALGVRHGAIAFLESQHDEMLSPVHRQMRHTILVSYVLPMARSLGWIDRASDDLATQELRAAVMTYAARMPGGESLRAAARELAMAWVGDRASLPAASAPAVLQTAARFADAATYERLENALERTSERHERELLVAALATVREPALRMRALDAALRDENAGGMQPAETLYFLEKMLGDEANRAAGFAALRERWDAWLAKLPAESAARLIDPLANLCTRRDRQDFAAFFQPRVATLRGATQKYANALESVDVCVAAASASSAERSVGPAPKAKPRPSRRRRR
jgi:alanyl aminopeptidase